MEGDTLTVTWGEEHYQVTNFSGFRVGPFSLTTTIKPNETYEQAWARVWNTLEGHALKMFIAKRNGFTERYAARG